MDNRKPIETAPLDGTRILVWIGEDSTSPHPVKWIAARNAWILDNGFKLTSDYFTYWEPISNFLVNKPGVLGSAEYTVILERREDGWITICPEMECSGNSGQSASEAMRALFCCMYSYMVVKENKDSNIDDLMQQVLDKKELLKSVIEHLRGLDDVLEEYPEKGVNLVLIEQLKKIL